MRVNRWDERLTVSQTNQVLSLLSRHHLDLMSDGQVKLDLVNALERADFKYLCLYELPLDISVADYGNARQVLAFFQKRKDLVLEGVDPQAAAWETFTKAEALCFETNNLFRSYSQGGFYFRQRVESVLYVAQQKISRILGEVPSLEDLRLRFGPGATTQVKKRDASARRKLSQAFCCSEEAIRFLPDLLAEVPLWSQAPEVEGLSVTVPVSIDNAQVDFVRKTAKTDRTIAKEPALNGMVQIALGDWIASLLRKTGVDTRDQTRNKRLAREGSLTGALATLDLSSASDTVSCGLVESLLPYDWWDFLRSFRCSHVRTPKGLLSLSKFSTMGNGFTFALETLIFYALAKACAELANADGPVSVYGDDIIVPTSCFDWLVEVLVATGFIVNVKKSFSTGSFRESCGGDYYSGISVRPCYIKDSLSGSDLFILHNFYVREGRTDASALVRTYLSDELVLYGPDGFGDGHLIGDWSPVHHNRELGWAGYTFETYTYKPNRVFYRTPLSADYVFPSYSIYVGSNAEVDLDLYGLKTLKSDGTQVLHSTGSISQLRRSPILRGKGSIRPDNSQSQYDQKGRLSDTLTGVAGYKRIKIYTMKRG